ncbi:hypothetical protein AP1H75_01640 [Apilactobacillus apinorum]
MAGLNIIKSLKQKGPINILLIGPFALTIKFNYLLIFDFGSCLALSVINLTAF